MRHTLASLGLVLATLATPGCVMETGSDTQNSSELKDLYEDGKNLDLGDLLGVASGFATDELNDALSVTPFASIEVAPTELYALSESAEEDLTLKNLDTLVSGLVARYGDKELTTEVNVARRNHLLSSSDVVYGESAFKVRLGLHDWGHDVGGFADVTTRIGFDASRELEARVINAYDSEWDATLNSPLEAVKSVRGFVLPRSVADLRALAPGESYALHGEGRLGLNLGAGVPIMVAAVDALSYNLVLSGGLRALLEGAIDVQVVKLDGDRLVVDVGVERTSVREARLALRDGWGISGLVEQHVTIGGIDLDLGRLVEKALQKRLNDKLNLIEATLEKTGKNSRLSVARFRVDLASANPGSPVEAALAQLLHADLRLAQALANRDEPGIEQEFELSRSGVSSASYAGIDILGMSFFRKVEEGEGAVTIQTPGGARSVLFESLHKESGWFFSSHGYTRVGLSGMVFDAQNPAGAMGEANLIFQVVEGDDYMQRDKLLDHLDGVILGVGGPNAMAAIEQPANELERFVEASCPNSQAYDPCRTEVLSHPTVAQLRQQGMSALGQAVAGLDATLQELVLGAGELRLSAQAAYEPKASLVGPPTSVVVDYRMDDLALEHLMVSTSSEDFRAALLRYLQVAGIDRIDKSSKIASEREEIAGDYAALAAEASKKWEQLAKRYRAMVTAEGITLPRHPELGEMGSSAIEIRFPVSSDKRVDYEKTTAGSMAQARSRLASGLVDGLIDVIDDGGKGLDNHPEQIVAYTLLGLAPAGSVDLRLDVDMGLDDNWAQSFEHYVTAGYESIDLYGRGRDVAPIDGGLFDLDALLDVD